MPGYSSFIIAELSGDPGDIAIMGSSNDDGVYDINIGIPISGCSHVWDDGVETVPATYVSDGTKLYTCTKCGETKTEVIPKLISEVNVKDIVRLKKFMASSENLDADALVRADVDNDGSVTMRDIQRLRQNIAAA